MITLRIRELLASKGIDNPFAWLRQQRIPHNACYKLLNKKYERPPLRWLSLICAAAHCTPNDLLEWQAGDKSPPLPAGHPMLGLLPRASSTFLADAEKLTEEQLKELEKVVKEMKGDGK